MEAKKLKNYINGQWVESKTNQWLEVKNPAKDEVIALIPETTKEEIDWTVRVAQEAFWSWRITPLPRRAKLLFDFHEKLDKHIDEIAILIVNENGKTLADARGEITRAMEYVEHACAGPELMNGSHAEDVGTGVDTLYIREPLGPYVFLPPFNFPAMIALYFVWGIAAGNTAIIKSSRLCPMTITRIIEIAEECGLPKGVVNLLHGSGSGVGDVGFKNYLEILGDFNVMERTDAGLQFNYKNFYWTLFMTVMWTITNVSSGVSLGLLLALILNTKGLAFRSAYRVLLILPWAMPNYITGVSSGRGCSTSSSGW